MADKIWKDLQTPQYALKTLVGSFTPWTDEAVLHVSGCVGFTTTRVASGTFKVALDASYPALAGFHVQYRPSGSIDGTYVAGRSIVAVPQGNAGQLPSKNLYFTLCQMSGSATVKAGTPVDVAGTVNDRVDVQIYVLNSSLKK
jgi:hypothetical protein